MGQGPTATSAFEPRRYLPRELYDAVTDVRVRQPGLVDEEAGRRARRGTPAPAGRLVIVAADHPGRRSLGIEDDPLAMADRHDLLARILRVLSHPGVDGVMSTPDVVEDLLILAGLLRERGGRSLLDDRLLVGCMNRGGRPGTVWEMDDRCTAFDTRRMLVLRMDGGKLVVRIDPADAGSQATVDGCARAITALAEADLLAFLEPLPVVRPDGVHRVQTTVPALVGAVSAASAFGASSLHTWLEVPTCPGFERVAAATTLPLVIPVGEATGEPRPVLEGLRAALQAGRNVRGATIGRNVLHPGPDDPRAVAAAIAAIVHDGTDVDTALATLQAERGKDPDLL